MRQTVSKRVTAKITGTGSYLPVDTVDNFDLYELGTLKSLFDVDKGRASLKDIEEVEDLSDSEVFDLWARQVTGIEMRRRLTPESGLTTEDMCAAACLSALEAAGCASTDMDLLIAASLTMSDEVPNAACTIANKIGAPQLGGYVLNAACAGYVYAIGAAWSAILSGMAQRVLVVAGDTLTRFVDYDETQTAVLFGDGAGACVLEKTEGEIGLMGPPAVGGEFDRTPLFLRGQRWEEEGGPSPVIHMEGGPRILRNAVMGMADVAQQALARAALAWTDVDVVIPHQANLRITKGLEKQLELSKGRVIHNIQRYGNMSAATVAITLDEYVRGLHGPVAVPSTIVLTAIGGGYTKGALVVRI
ncbi:MAG: ketoacyl-ACP synthase III [Gemmatimonadota bacterium]|nr:ketoacyl-ACP synthase III [Gemmatimonadota bacterium]